MYTIYQITCNGKDYYGVTKQAVERRAYQHACRKDHFGYSMKKHGYSVKTIAEFQTEEEAYSYEASLVTDELLSSGKVWNSISGGIGGWKGVTPEIMAERNRREHSASEKAKRVATLKERYRKQKHHMAGVPKPDSWKELMREKMSGRQVSEDARQRMSEAQRRLRTEGKITSMPPDNTGRTYSMKLLTCPHCGKQGRGGNMGRYHFDNCKHKAAEA